MPMMNIRLIVTATVSLLYIFQCTHASSAPLLNLHVQIDLNKVGVYSNCSMAAVSDLEDEMRDWIHEELHVVAGEKGFEIPRAVALDRHDKLQFSALVRCKEGCIQPETKKNTALQNSMESIAKTLQWSSPAVVRRWFVDSSRLLNGCMGDTIRASVTVRELDFDPDTKLRSDTKLRKPIILGLDDIASERVNATIIGASAV